MAATEPVVTEIVITAQQAEATLARIEAAYSHLGDRAEAAQARATAAWERQMQSLTKLPQSIERVSAAYERIQGSLNPVIAAQQRAEREMTQSLAVINRAVLLNVTTEEQAAKDIAALRNKQIADIARVREAQLRGAAANQNNRFAALNATNQFQDIAVTAAMGQSVGTIALQQGTQLGMALQQSLGDKGAAGAAKVLGSAITGLFTPINLLAIGLTALVAVGIKLVNWGQTAASVVMSFAHLLPKIADYAAIAAAGLALLYAPALLSGLTLLSEAILGVTARLVGLAIGFAAANPGVAFVLGITAIVVALNIFRDDLRQAFGVDIIGVVKTGVNYIINSFRAAFSDIQFVWRSFPDIMAAAVTGAVNWVLDGIKRMVNAGVDGINSLINGVNNIAAKIGGDKAAQFFGFSGKIGTISQWGGIDPMSDGGAADRLSKANASHAADIQGIMSTDSLGQFGTGIAKGAALATDKLKELAKWLTTVKDKSKKSHGKTEEEKFEDIVTRAQGRINALKAEQAGLGMTDLAAEKLKDETELLNEAQRKGITLTAAQRDQLISLADQMAETAIQTKRAREALDFAKDATKGFMDDLRQGLANGEGFWKSFGNAALNVLNKIIDKIETDLINALFDVKNAGGGGGLGSLILSGVNALFGVGGGGSGLSDFAQVAISGSTGLFAKGGTFQNGISGYSNSIVSSPTLFRFAHGTGLMGEAGPEGILPLRRNSAGQLGVIAANDRAANQNAPQEVNINVNVSGARGNQEIQQMVASGVSQGIDEFSRKQLPFRFKEIKADERAVG
ncbi:MAG: phage tail length tape measure family protein [Rhizobiaceae bacterium]